MKFNKKTKIGWLNISKHLPPLDVDVLMSDGTTTWIGKRDNGSVLCFLVKDFLSEEFPHSYSYKHSFPLYWSYISPISEDLINEARLQEIASQEFQLEQQAEEKRTDLSFASKREHSEEERQEAYMALSRKIRKRWL